MFSTIANLSPAYCSGLVAGNLRWHAFIELLWSPPLHLLGLAANALTS